jgi:hypothetical protein
MALASRATEPSRGFILGQRYVAAHVRESLADLRHHSLKYYYQVCKTTAHNCLLRRGCRTTPPSSTRIYPCIIVGHEGRKCIYMYVHVHDGRS